MKVLVAVASKHGATADIADRVAGILRATGHDVTQYDITHGHVRAESVEGYDAYVIGSAIYEGHWLRTARHFVLDHAITLQRGEVHLFSSGPLDDENHVGVDTHKIDELIHAVDAVEHRMFSGRLDRGDLNRLERWVVDVVKAHDGDYRDWTAIDAWATGLSASFAGANAH
jgi:menaquinone-dependent protoporphyrinogen oxidase